MHHITSSLTTSHVRQLFALFTPLAVVSSLTRMGSPCPISPRPFPLPTPQPLPRSSRSVHQTSYLLRRPTTKSVRATHPIPPTCAQSNHLARRVCPIHARQDRKLGQARFDVAHDIWCVSSSHFPNISLTRYVTPTHLVGPITNADQALHAARWR